MPRVKDRGLLDYVKTLPCVLCGDKNTDAHHVTSRGAGGGDTRDNIMPLCRKHHIYMHSKGIFEAIRQYPKILSWLRNMSREDILSKFEFLEYCRGK